MVRSSPRGTRPVWSPFNSHHTPFTLRECSIIPFICCTESVCATKGVYSMPNNFRLACIFFITCAATVQTCLANSGLCVTCSSEICFHLLRRLSNLSSLKGAGICCIFMTLWWPAEPGWDLSGPVYIRIVLYIPVYIYNIFIFYFGSLDRDLFCCFKFIFNMQKLNNPQHWRFNEALCTMCCNISFGKEVFWNGNYLVLGRFTLWPRAEMHLRKDMCKYKRPCSEHQMSQCRMQM